MTRRSYKGKNNPNWNGGLRRNNGYWMVHVPGHPHSWQGYVYEHRLVVERIIGRPLRQEESVHHIDGDKLNNKPENLVAFRNHSAHIRWTRHIKGNTETDANIKKGDVVFDGRTYDNGKHLHVPAVQDTCRHQQNAVR